MGLTGQPEDSPTTQLPLALATPAEEDTGAVTQDRFKWQHHCIAIDYFRMADDANIQRIVCEIHEDYIVVYEDHCELVSCKHRELTQTPWTLTTICNEGGLAHLYSRWLALPGSTARLMTSAGLTPGPLQAASLPAICAELADGQPLEGVRANMCFALARALLAAGRARAFTGIPKTSKGTEPTAEMLASVGSFMCVLTIRSEVANRAVIRGHHIIHVAQPAAASLQFPAEQAEHAYDEVLTYIASKNVGTSIAGDYCILMTSPPAGLARRQLEAKVEARTLRRDALLRAVRVGTSRSLTATRLEQRLRRKLQEGRVQATRVEAASMYRERWLQEWAQLRSDLPGDETSRAGLELKLVDLAGDIQAQLATSHPYGDQMYENLRNQVDTLDTSTIVQAALPPELVLGAAFDLAARCKIWFSPEFDVDAPETE